jgi:hypothetical protein
MALKSNHHFLQVSCCLFERHYDQADLLATEAPVAFADGTFARLGEKPTRKTIFAIGPPLYVGPKRPCALTRMTIPGG